jgi:hypothetical protein
MPKLTPIHKPTIQFRAPKGALTHGFMGNPHGVVLHDTEGHDTKGIADISGVISFWMGTPDKLGAHFIVDAEGNIGQSGEPTELMYHCGGANTGYVGIEQIGFARFTKQQWEARPDQLIKVAKLLAWLNAEYHIPLRVSTVNGVSTHAMQSKIHPESQGHTDPGSGYPLEEVLAIAKGFKDAGGWPPDNQAKPTPTKPAKPAKPRVQHVYHVTYTTRKGDRKTATTFQPGLWVVSHPRAKRRGDVLIHRAK